MSFGGIISLSCETISVVQHPNTIKIQCVWHKYSQFRITGFGFVIFVLFNK